MSRRPVTTVRPTAAPRTSSSTAVALSLPIALALPWSVSAAQQPDVRVRTLERPLAIALEDVARGASSLFAARLDPDRASLGVSLRTGTAADTAGLEVLDVAENGPAAKAGLAAGVRLLAINGVSLKVSPDDARDPLTVDVAWRRLQRELDKVTAGDTVTLTVHDARGPRTVSLATVTARALEQTRLAGVAVRAPSRAEAAASREALANRAALGINLATMGNVRDTLGVFVTSVVADGPAERAGIVEGDRIAAINGVNLRVPREDVSDPMAGQARVARLQRELSTVAPGATVTLQVYSGGRTRDLTVTAGRASDLGPEGVRFEFRTMPAEGRLPVRTLSPRVGRSTR
jgi:predicted metalloprotease with PDZ domain